jgi:MFS family permease
VPGAFYLTNSFYTALVFFALMGFVLLSLFGGYAIYFPELFPTRLRATGTGFCYNVARFLSASGPQAFGYISGKYGIQRAALILSSVFILGLLIIPFAPETKGKELPT